MTGREMGRRGGRRAFAVVAAGGVVVATLALPAPAAALPRFAIRSGADCIQCHVSPSGGGMRNAYGRGVFELTWLPMSARREPEPWPPEGWEDGGPVEQGPPAAAPADEPAVSFSGQLDEWLAVGSDVRAAYVWSKPDRGVTPEAEPQVTSSLFLMEAYLYVAATVHEHVTLMLQLGPYSGFEAWGLFTLFREPEEWNLTAKVGYFFPAFGIRKAQHQLFTREQVGFGNTDRDTGLEVTGYMGPVTASLAVVNGTLGGSPFDDFGSDRKRFEKALIGRLGVRLDVGWLRLELGASSYYSRNQAEPSPLFAEPLAALDADELGRGLDEVRAGPYLMANVGPFTYMADLVYVRDDPYSDRIAPIGGYTSFQELSVLPIQGLDLIARLEFMDRDLDLLQSSATRASFTAALFPWPYTELLAEVRRRWDDTAPDVWDVTVMLHVFL